MPTHQEIPAPTAVQLRGVVDLPLVAEQLQDQLDDLRAVAQAQQSLSRAGYSAEALVCLWLRLGRVVLAIVGTAEVPAASMP